MKTSYYLVIWTDRSKEIWKVPPANRATWRPYKKRLEANGVKVLRLSRAEAETSNVRTTHW